jgi:hypothetical protein
MGHGPIECGNKQAPRTKLGRFLWAIRLKWVKVQRHQTNPFLIINIYKKLFVDHDLRVSDPEQGPNNILSTCG